MTMLHKLGKFLLGKSSKQKENHTFLLLSFYSSSPHRENKIQILQIMLQAIENTICSHYSQ